MASSRLLLCNIFLILLPISYLQSEAAVNRIPALYDVAVSGNDIIYGCDHCPSGKCCLCSFYRTRPVCNSCCDDDAATSNVTTSMYHN